MPRCLGTPAIATLPELPRDGRAPAHHFLIGDEKPIRIFVSAPEVVWEGVGEDRRVKTGGVRNGNFFFGQRDEPIDVTPRELANLKLDGRLAITVPGEHGAEVAEKDTTIAAQLQEIENLRGKNVILEGQVADRDALIRRQNRELEEATAPNITRSTLSTTEPKPVDRDPEAPQVPPAQRGRPGTRPTAPQTA